MAFEKESSEAKDTFMNALEENYFLEEINQLKISLEENKISIDTLKNHLIEKEKHNKKLECEIVSLRKEIEKVKTLNPRFAKRSETLDEIIKVQCSPLVKTCLGYIGDSSQYSTPSYLNVAKASLQHSVTREENKETSQVNHDHFNTKNNRRNIKQRNINL